MNLAKNQNIALFAMLVVIAVALSIALPNKFLTVINLQSMASQFPEFGLLALAMVLAMITGGIDLSIVATANLCGVVAAYILSNSMGTALTPVFAIPLAVFAVLVVSIICGLINGLLIARMNVPPILATLGTQGLFMGTAIVITGGHSISTFPDEFSFVGNANVLAIPVPFIIFVIAAIFVGVILNKSRQGFNMTMIGANFSVSKFSGVNNARVLIKTYVIVAILAGIASLIMISRANSMRPGYGEAYLLSTILVAVLGGTDPDGGFGNLWGVIMGIFILQLTQSGLNILSVSPFFTRFVWGAALLLMLVINFYLPKYKERKHLRQLIAAEQEPTTNANKIRNTS